MTGNHNSRINDYCAVAVYGFNGQNSITAAGVEAREELSPAITRNKQTNVLYAAGFIDRTSAESCGIGYEKEKHRHFGVVYCRPYFAYRAKQSAELTRTHRTEAA